MAAEKAGGDDLRADVREDGPAARWLEIEVPADRVDEAFERAYRELARSVRLPGFRPGKTPHSVLRNRYGAAVAEDVERDLVAHTLAIALERSALVPVSEPAVEASAPAEHRAFAYRARVEVKPPLELGDLRGLEARRPSAEVADADVERELESLRQRHASLVEEREGATAAPGHFLTIDYQGRVDGKPFEGGRARDLTIELGAGQLLAGFDEQLVGVRAGEDRIVRARFASDLGNAALAGKDVEFQVRVTSLRRREVPALDDEFAKDLGEFETLDPLRARVRETLVAARARRQRVELRRSLLDCLAARVPFEVPAGAVAERLERRLHAASHELGEHGIARAALDRQLALWEEEWRPAVERELREEWLLQEVARREDLSIDDRELDERLGRIAEEQGRDAARLRKAYRESGALEAVRAQLLEEKAVEFLLGGATVEDVAGP
jgi:trigger factor